MKEYLAFKRCWWSINKYLNKLSRSSFNSTKRTTSFYSFYFFFGCLWKKAFLRTLRVFSWHVKWTKAPKTLNKFGIQWKYIYFKKVADDLLNTYLKNFTFTSFNSTRRTTSFSSIWLPPEKAFLRTLGVFSWYVKCTKACPFLEWIIFYGMTFKLFENQRHGSKTGFHAKKHE